MESKIISSFYPHTKDGSGQSIWELQNIKEAYLNTTDFTSTPGFFKFGNDRHVNFMTLIAVVILIIAWVNYINLFTAKFTERQKEVGVRKTSGAGKKHIVFQFITESAIFNIVAAILSVGIFGLILIISRGELPFLKYGFILTNVSLWVVVFVILFTGIIVSGGYPAIILASLQPQRILKSQIKSTSVFSLRSGLVIFQFIIVIAVVSFTVHVNKQLHFINTVDLGFDKDQILVLNAPKVDIGSNRNEKLKLFKNEITKIAGIQDVCASQSIPGQRLGYGNSVNRVNYDIQQSYTRIGYVMPNFVDFYGLELAAGQAFDFSGNPDIRTVIINESEAKQLEFETPEEAINQKVRWGGRQFTIVGVVKDFHMESLHKRSEPMMFHMVGNNCDYLSIKLSSYSVFNNIDKIKQAYYDVFPGNPFDYFFLDGFFNAQYFKDIQFQKIFNFFSILTIIIGYLGLFGLTTYGVIQRTKEIGIRKANGANVPEILTLLNVDLIKWIMIAVLISVPVAWAVIHKWLENFVYRIEVSWLIFAITGIIVLTVAFMTTSLQCWKAATRNPVEALRYE
jgi:putative ABC transport system permease protein